MRQKIKSYFLNKSQSFFLVPKILGLKSVVKTLNLSPSQLITHIKASDGKLSQNFTEASDFFKNHFGNFKFSTLFTESACELLLDNHFRDLVV